MGLNDPVNLVDPVWTTLYIALFLNQKPDSVLGVVNFLDFPSPLANQRRNRRWWAVDMQEFFVKRSHRELPAGTPFLIDKCQSPKTLRIKATEGQL